MTSLLMIAIGVVYLFLGWAIWGSHQPNHKTWISHHCQLVNQSYYKCPIKVTPKKVEPK